MYTVPWLSILIPTYNGEDFLSVALDSIYQQNDPDIECIAIDDGSTDTTPVILSEYANKIPLTILKQSRQGNWVANTNYGLSICRGQYVCFLHQDDLWLPDRLSIMKKLVREFPQAVFFLHPSYYLDTEGNRLGLWQCPLPAYPKVIKSNLMIEKLLIQNFIAIPAPIVKKSTAELVSGLDSKSWYTADWDFWLKISACGQGIYYPRPLSGFRIHPASQTVTRSSSLDDFRNQLEVVFERHFSKWNAPDYLRKKVHSVGRFSIEVNVALASRVHGNTGILLPLIIKFILLGPSGWVRYFTDSRLWERVSSRLKIQLQPANFQKEKFKPK